MWGRWSSVQDSCGIVSLGQRAGMGLSLITLLQLENILMPWIYAEMMGGGVGDG